MTPKTGAIRLATLRVFLPDGGCALSGLRSVRPAFNLFTMLTETPVLAASKPPVALLLTGATALVRFGSPEKAQCAASGPPVRSPAPPGIISVLARLDVRQVGASQSAASGFSTPLRCPV